MTRAAVAIVGAVAVLGAVAVEAGPLRFAVEARAGTVDLTNARRTAEAIFGGSSGGLLVGLAARVDYKDRFFVRLGASRFQREGQRVFVAEPSAEVFPVGYPLTLRLIPLTLDVGYSPRRGRRLRPYLGLGSGAVLYSERSDVAGDVETLRRTRFTARAFTGATWAVGPLALGAELAYALVPNAIGGADVSHVYGQTEDVSHVYGETDIGGFQAVATVTWRP